MAWIPAIIVHVSMSWFISFWLYNMKEILFELERRQVHFIY